MSDTNIASTSSFKYSSPSTALKSTQQLNVDWSQFQNHTFFMSAEANVNLAFDSIINGFPFDGTRKETEVFFEKLSGFDKWVFDNFPTYKGELLFSGTQAGETSPQSGTYVAVQNKAGVLFPELSTQNTGASVLNPTGSMSYTVEMQLFLPTIVNDVQVVCQMMSSPTQGFSLYLTQSTSTSNVNATFMMVSGSTYMSVPLTLNKGTFNHIAVELNRTESLPYLQSFLNSTPFAESSTQVELGDMDINNASLLIGSGTVMQMGSSMVTPMQTMSGTLDEFRIFSSPRTANQLTAYASKALYATDDLLLYYRFNEPPPPLTTTLSDPINGIVLDSSGNALHAIISNFTGSLRIDASADSSNPVVYERADSLPVLFPAYPPTVAFNQQLLMSASAYDQENPNLITRLVPEHYLLEGAFQDGFIDSLSDGTTQPNGGSGIPGQGQMGNVQILVSLLYIWARFFDDIKLFIDSFSTLKTVDYNTNDTVPDMFMLDLIKDMGFYLPPLFNDSTIDQYIHGENIDLESYTVSRLSLQQVQNSILRRVLVNLPRVLKSKGTQYSIKAFLRAVGMDPGNNIRIREYGGPTTQQLQFSRESKLEPGTMVEFSTGSLVTSPYLSASRVEPGYPQPRGSFVLDRLGRNAGTTFTSDGLLTSGSWTWESIVKYTPPEANAVQSLTQSLVRFCTTGSANGGPSVIANLLAFSSSLQPRLVLYARPGDAATSPTMRLELDASNSNIFNSDKWNVSFGCQRGDDGLASTASSSYFLRLAYQNVGAVEYIETTSSFFYETPTSENNVFRSVQSTSNASGSFLSMGTTQFFSSGSGIQFIHLNNNSSVPDEARATCFNGRMSNVRFWSKALSDDEWREHVRNYNSTGVENPLINWNYATTPTGSWERLRLNSLVMQDMRQAITTATSAHVTGDPVNPLGPVGSIVFPDFSENGFHLTGSTFPTNQDIVVGEVFELSSLSPYFDEATCDDKVRVRSYLDYDLVEQTSWASLAPVYEIPPSETPTDDVRFTVEFSLIEALNRDIVTMFATFDAIDNALGAPELVFSPDYPDISRLRDIYFNRIKAKLNFQAFFEFFRWFDTSLGTFIQQLLPRKTLFDGVNYTIESHMLERAKQEYVTYNSYLGDSNRTNLNSAILLQQINGVVSKH